MCVCVKLQALVYDILPSLEEGAGKRCSECVCVWYERERESVCVLTALMSHLTTVLPDTPLRRIILIIFFNSPKWCIWQHCSVVARLVPRETVAFSAHVMCGTPYNHAPVCSFIRSRLYHLHFWQNDLDLLYTTGVTRGGTDTEIRVSTAIES